MKPQITPHNHNILLTILFFCMLSCTSTFAQPNFTQYYDPVPSYDFNYPESYIIQRFYPSNQYNLDGTLIIESVETSGTHRSILIHLVDNSGVFTKAFTVFDNETGNFVPTCAAFNSYVGEYCIAGIVEDPTTPAINKSWFLFLDPDLNIISIQVTGIQLTGTSPYDNLYVSDICTIESPYAVGQGYGDFVFVGVCGNNSDPIPMASTTATQTMVVGALTSAGPVAYRPFDFGSAAVNNAFFPSRIIETPDPTEGGFVITGTSPKDLTGTVVVGSIFFLRLDYGLANFPNASNPTLYPELLVYESDLSTNVGDLSAGDLFWDENEHEIWFAGVSSGGTLADNAFIYQKLRIVPGGGLQVYPTLATTSSAGSAHAFGFMTLVDNAFPKIAKISQSLTTSVASIVSNYFESSTYSVSLNSLSYPMLNQIDYSAAALDDFENTQQLLITTYPRPGGNIGFNNYLSYLSYNNNFYPSHTAHQYPLNVFTTEDYAMGQTVFNLANPALYENMVLNKTDNYIDIDCYKSERPLDADFIVPDDISNTFTSPGDYVFTPDDNTLNNDSEDIDDIPSYYCDVWNLYFKPNSINTTQNNSYLQSYENNKLVIKFSSDAKSYNLFNAFGSRIITGNTSNSSVQIDMSNYANGMYFIEFRNEKLERIYTSKFIK
ncbi:MAG: T9SS type A sorting domain-containing protein [Bacteroidetes bacterium]|nr:T9SS type A sorting domain-containing protein [Bacteroidota bacterium]